MGNFRSGRRRVLRGPSDADCLGFSVYDLKRLKALDLEPDQVFQRITTWGSSRLKWGMLNWKIEADEQARPNVIWLAHAVGQNIVVYPVHFTTTRCHFGGVRWWFICPAEGCGRRVGKLWLPPWGHQFVCRRCAGIIYSVKRERPSQRYARRATKIRGRLGWGGPFDQKRPRGMHRTTYRRLSVLHDVFYNFAVMAMLERRC